MDLSIYKNTWHTNEEVDYNYDVFKLLNAPKLIIEHNNNKKPELRIVNDEGKIIGYIYKSYTYKMFNSIFFKLFIYNSHHELILMIKQSFSLKKQIITTYLPGKNDYVYFKQIGKVVISERKYSLFTDELFAEMEIIPSVNDFVVKSKGFALGCVDTKWLNVAFNAYNVRFDLSCEKKTRGLYERYKTDLDFLQRAVVLSAGILVDFGRFMR